MTVTVTFGEEDIQAILNAAYFGEGKCPLKASKLTAEQYAALQKELTDASDGFAVEIVENSGEGCANDWLSDFSQKYMGGDGDDGDDGECNGQ
jgi:hypothetical protein